MRLVLKNQDLPGVINLLNITTAKGRAARSVARFRTIMMGKLKVYHDEEMELFKDFCELNEEGEVIVSNGTVTFLDEKKEEGIKSQKELVNEENIIDLTEFEPYIEFIISALENSDTELNISQMETLDTLLSKFEELRKEDEYVNSK